jgi:AcrR family transcriptional regulator
MTTRICKRPRSMRKQPRQARSRDTVDVIVEAGAQVLARKGWSGFNTNDVAATAGVSIGSIYQYFPDKLVLIDAIRLRHLDQVLKVFDLPSRDDDDLESRVGCLIDGMIASHHLHPGLHRVLLDEVPRPDTASADDQRFGQAYRQRFRAFVAAATGLTKASSLALSASVIASAVEGMVHEAIRLDARKARPFRDEIVNAVVSYLQAKRR